MLCMQSRNDIQYDKACYFSLLYFRWIFSTIFLSRWCQQNAYQPQQNIIKFHKLTKQKNRGSRTSKKQFCYCLPIFIFQATVALRIELWFWIYIIYIFSLFFFIINLFGIASVVLYLLYLCMIVFCGKNYLYVFVSIFIIFPSYSVGYTINVL